MSSQPHEPGGPDGCATILLNQQEAGERPELERYIPSTRIPPQKMLLIKTEDDLFTPNPMNSTVRSPTFLLASNL